MTKQLLSEYIKSNPIKLGLVVSEIGGGSGNYFMLCQISKNWITFIGLDSANRWVDPIQYGLEITAENLKQLLGEYLNKWVVEEIRISSLTESEILIAFEE